MDFAKLVTEYLNQKTEGDPSFIVSEESLAFVDLMRADDMDRRASGVEANTSSDARGEPSNEDVASEPMTDPFSESGSEAEPVMSDGSGEIITEPASPFSDVALGEDQDAGSISEMPEADTSLHSASIFSEDGDIANPLSAFSEESLPSDPASVFTEDGSQAAANESLREEGVSVSENASLHSDVTILEPPGMPDFQSLLQSFDRDYHAPDPPAGDLDLIPEAETPEPSDPLQSTTEHCESMMSGILNSYMADSRRGA